MKEQKFSFAASARVDLGNAKRRSCQAPPLLVTSAARLSSHGLLMFAAFMSAATAARSRGMRCAGM